MMGVDFSALCLTHGKYHIIGGTCLVGSSDPVRIQNAIKYWLREEKEAELIKVLNIKPF